MVLAEGGWPSTWLVLVTLVGGSLAAGGANAINMVIDRDIDALMERTRNRPLVTGVIQPREAMVFAVSLEVLALVVLWIGANLLAGLLAISATAFYVGVYSLWLKRTSRQNIVIGGAAGAVPVLVGWAAIHDSLAWTPVVLFAAIFFWTPPHFWALALRYADDYRAADVPMLPAVVPFDRAVRQMVGHTIALVAMTLLLVPVARWERGVGAETRVDLPPLRSRPRPRVPRGDDPARSATERPPLDAGLRFLDHLRDGSLRGAHPRRPHLTEDLRQAIAVGAGGRADLPLRQVGPVVLRCASRASARGCQPRQSRRK